MNDLTIKDYFEDGDLHALQGIKKEYDYYVNEVFALYTQRDTLLACRRSIADVTRQINELQTIMRYRDERRQGICFVHDVVYERGRLPAAVKKPLKHYYKEYFNDRPVYVAPVDTDVMRPRKPDRRRKDIDIQALAWEIKRKVLEDELNAV